MSKTEIFSTYRLVNCEMVLHGPGTSFDRISTVCLLPLNAFNEMAFLAVYIWLCLLGVVTLVHLTFLLMICFNKAIRAAVIKSGLNPTAQKCVVNMLLSSPGIGPWFHLLLVKRNTDDLTFTEFVVSAERKILVENPRWQSSSNE